MLLGNGTGAFSTAASVATGLTPYSLALADFNADGNLDVVVGNQGDSTVTVLLGDGTGSFHQASGSPVAAGSQPSSVIAADFNRDGKVDLAVADQGASTLSILLGNGNGTFQTATTLPAGPGAKYIAALDYNNDGKLDMVSVEDAGVVSIYPGNGDGTFATRLTSAAGGSGYSWITTADFDGDGIPDFSIPVTSYNVVGVGLDHFTHTATATLSSVSVPGSGSHNVTATYAGDTQDATSTSSTIALTASQAATTLTLQAAPTGSHYGQQVVLSATLTPSAIGSLTTNGETVTFLDNGTSIGSGTLASGVATFSTTSLTMGTHSITASYPADANFLASTAAAIPYTVGKTTPVIAWGAPASIPYGTALSSTQLNASSGGVSGSFVYSPASGAVLSVGANQALSLTFTPTDTSNYNSATATNSITVTQASPTLLLASSMTPSTYGSAVTFTATLPAGASGTITFKDGAATLGTGTLSAGAATLTTNSLSVGSHSITATWPGDSNYMAGAASPLTQTVSQAAVTIAASSSLNPSLFGDTIKFTFHFSGSGAVPTGTATLQDGATTLATLTLDASGNTSYSAAAFTAGTHTLHAVYNGDVHYF